MLAEGSTTFHGEFYNIVDAPCDPKPVQSPLPLLVGTRGPRMLRIAVRHANEWNTWNAPDLAERRAALLGACETAARAPGTRWSPGHAPLALGGSAPSPGRPARAGTAQQLVDPLGQYAELGFD